MADDIADRVRKIIIEQGVGGKATRSKPADRARELEVAVLGNDDPKASVVGKIVPAKEFYDYEAKYESDASLPIIPAKLSKVQAREVRDMAIAAFHACDCSGLARVDFLLEPESRTGKPGRLYLNEINTMPGFTSISMYPKLWEASGLKYSDLIDRLAITPREFAKAIGGDPEHAQHFFHTGQLPEQEAFSFLERVRHWLNMMEKADPADSH